MINSLPKSLIETAKKILIESTHPMIDVDGNQKHRHNSEGRPIHHTDDGIRNFHRWFGDSVTVDEHGRPKVYYHGTSKDFSKFDPKKSFTGIGVSFFSPDKKFADSYDYHHNVGTVMPVYIKARNIFDFHNNKHRDILQKYMGENTYYNNFVGGKRPMSEKFPESRDYFHMEHPLVINAIKDLKHDSFLVDERGTSNIAVFNPKNVKSALGNSGDFGKTSSLTEEHKETKHEPYYNLVEWKKAAKAAGTKPVNTGQMSGVSHKVNIWYAEHPTNSQIGGSFFHGKGWDYGHMITSAGI